MPDHQAVPPDALVNRTELTREMDRILGTLTPQRTNRHPTAIRHRRGSGAHPRTGGATSVGDTRTHPSDRSQGAEETQDPRGQGDVCRAQITRASSRTLCHDAGEVTTSPVLFCKRFRPPRYCERMRRRRNVFPHGLSGSHNRAAACRSQRTMAGPGAPLTVPVQCEHPVQEFRPTGHCAPSQKELSVPAVVAKVRPSVVTVLTRGVPSGGSQHGAPPGSGSGVILDPGGYILTNNHLVQGVTSVVVGLSTGRLTPGRVVARDFLLDLALVRSRLRIWCRRNSVGTRRSKSEKPSSPSGTLSP